MKDKQLAAKPLLPGIPVISPVLHCLSMPALVFLRAAFGYAFLSPKSIFLSLVWAFALYAVYKWNYPSEWNAERGGLMFGFLASCLYLLHLVIAFTGELARSGKHDHDAGTSHLLHIRHAIPRLTPAQVARAESIIHLWLEPLLVFIAALFIAGAGAGTLAAFLKWQTFALWCKAVINHWSQLRHQKRHSDVFADAEESLEHQNAADSAPINAERRKPKQKRPRVD